MQASSEETNDIQNLKRKHADGKDKDVIKVLYVQPVSILKPKIRT